jgi:hypothetical protein
MDECLPTRREPNGATNHLSSYLEEEHAVTTKPDVRPDVLNKAFTETRLTNL